MARKPRPAPTVKVGAIERALERFAWWVDISGAPDWSVKEQAKVINAARAQLAEIVIAAPPEPLSGANRLSEGGTLANAPVSVSWRLGGRDPSTEDYVGLGTSDKSACVRAVMDSWREKE